MSFGSAIRLNELPLLDMSSSVPLHAQLSEILSSRMQANRLEVAGKLLPSEQEMCSYFGVSRPTVRQALGTLQRAGMVTRFRGKGTRVTPLRTARDIGRAFDVLPANQMVTYKLIERRFVDPPARVAQVLKLPANMQVERIKRYRYHGGEIIGFEERYIPLGLAGRLSSEQLNTDPGIIFGKSLIRGADGTVSFTIRAMLATATLARILKIKKGEAVLSSEHTYFDPQGNAVLYGTVMFRGEMYDFSFQAPINGV